MKLKQYHRYCMDFTCKAANVSAMCIGASLFALCFYFFLLRTIATIGAAEAILSLALPIVLMVAYISLMRFVKVNAPGMFALLGAAFCVILIFGTFASGNMLRVLLGCIWYLLCAVVLIATAGGYIPGTLPSAIMFAIAFLVRILFFAPRLRDIPKCVSELSSLCLLIALICLPLCFKPGKSKKHPDTVE